MKAVVKYGRGDREVALREMAEPSPGEGEVLLAVRAAGVCGSDIEMWHNWIDVCNVPVIQGHEFCGVVEELGPGVAGFRPGDRVVSETAAYVCGQCVYCRAGEYNQCPKRIGYGSGTHGAFARYVRVPVRCLHRIPGNVPDAHAALTEPACVAYNALVVKSDVRAGEPALILGPGPIGLMAVQIARIRGAYPIIVVGTELDAGRLEVATKVGAHRGVVVPNEDPQTVVRDLTDGQGVPLVVDAAGGTKALETAVALVARNGTITKIAWDHKTPEVNLNALVQKGARVQGSFSHTWRTWEAVLRLMSAGLLDVASMISHEMTIERFEEAYELVERRQAVKIVLRPV
jgi:alcohol dehydrogenase/L-iditol 2-dehydrogenase